MKKFFITTTIPTTLNFFRGNLRFLSDRFDVCAISSKHEDLQQIGEREGVRTHYIPMVRPIALLRDVVCLFKFVFFFLKERPYVVHGNTPKASMLSMVAAWVTRVPVRIYMCHGLRYQGTQGKMRKLLMWMEKLTCACATEVICVSNGVRDMFAADGICDFNKSVVIGAGSATGVDVEHFNPEVVEHNVLRTELGLSQDDFVFIFVGRLVTDKGINELVSAFDRLSEKYPQAHLVLIGNEELEQNPITSDSRNIINSNKHIYAIGRRTDVRPYLMDADAFVFPSYREGFGMVLIEANSMGIPAISSDIIGCNEIIIEGENGVLIPSRNEEALYIKMREWLEHPEEVKRMSAICRNTIVKRFNRSDVWNLYLKEFLRLVANR